MDPIRNLAHVKYIEQQPKARIVRLSSFPPVEKGDTMFKVIPVCLLGRSRKSEGRLSRQRLLDLSMARRARVCYSSAKDGKALFEPQPHAIRTTKDSTNFLCEDSRGIPKMTPLTPYKYIGH